MKEAPQSAQEFLRLALTAPTAQHRAQYAEMGLAQESETDADTRVLLMRQLYLVHLAAGRLNEALTVSESMTREGALRDLAHHDASRVASALGLVDRSIAEQRRAVRSSPASRRSFHYWSLATLMQFAGHLDEAQAALRRGERWAQEDRPLLRAQRAWARLAGGEAVRGLAVVFHDLATSKAREGYGQFVLGMLAHEMGDDRNARVYLRAFLRRNAGADPVKALTLEQELRRARQTLARIESD